MVRGRVIPVVDVRARQGMPAADETEESCIILIDVGTSQTGLVVDAVQDVVL